MEFLRIYNRIMLLITWICQYNSSLHQVNRIHNIIIFRSFYLIYMQHLWFAYIIHALSKANVTQKDIAAIIGLYKSTISREVRRNRGGRVSAGLMKILMDSFGNTSPKVMTFWQSRRRTLKWSWRNSTPKKTLDLRTPNEVLFGINPTMNFNVKFRPCYYHWGVCYRPIRRSGVVSHTVVGTIYYRRKFVNGRVGFVVAKQPIWPVVALRLSYGIWMLSFRFAQPW